MAHDNFGCGSGDGSVSRTAINTGPDGAAIPIFPAGSPPGSEVPVTTGTPDDPVTTGAPDGNLVGREIAYQAFLRATDGLAVLDSGVIICCNDALCAFLGHSREHLSGRPLTLFAPPRQAGGRSTAEALDQLLQRCLEGSPAVDAWCFCRPDGQPVQGELGLSSLGPGGPTLVAIRDTTARTRGEDTLRRRRAIFEAVSFMAERLFRTSTWTEELGPVLDSLGRAAEADAVTLWRIEPELKGRTEVTLWGAWPGHLNPAGRPIRSWSIDRSPLYDLLRVRLRSGEAIEWEHGRLPIELLEPEQKAGDLPVEAAPRARDGRGNAAGIRPRLVVPLFVESCLWGTLVFTFPESRGQINQPESEAMQLAAKILGAGIDRTAADEQLRSATEAMERATVYAKEMATEAMMASSAKGHFLASMSHEIRTPITGILGVLDLLGQTELNEEQNELANLARRSADGLLEIIQDILDFSKIESGGLTLEQTALDLQEVVEDAAHILAARADARGLELVAMIAPDVPTALIGDPVRLRQILLNLTGNAIKFTEKGEVVVSVTLEGLSEESANLRFEVRDTGIGVSRDALSRLFNEYAQAEQSTTRRFGGTGLGLAISRRLVEAMGSVIQVESEIGQGSRFGFVVSLRKQACSAVAPGATTSATTEPGTKAPAATACGAARFGIQGGPVLIIDDNGSSRRMLREQLAAWGFDVASAADPCEARNHLSAGPRLPVGILLDAQLGAEDGLDLLRWIRSNPSTAGVPVIFMSTLGDRARRHAAREFERVLLLSKPVRYKTLATLLARILNAGKSCGADMDQPVEAGRAGGDGTGNGSMTAGALAGYRVLLAEDNPINQKVAVRMLEKLGLQVDVADDGREAVEAARRTRYDLIFMDHQMPEMDGVEASIRIRANEGPARPVPIVALTAHALADIRRECERAGMSDFLAKPIRQAQLRETVRRWILDQTGEEEGREAA